ncbi:MAG: hypothetical protein CME04_05140 [Gemmatimonadaceae bacterium]|nr:hypothetical protein [Gemmatimonadaceae bacterium]
MMATTSSPETATAAPQKPTRPKRNPFQMLGHYGWRVLKSPTFARVLFPFTMLVLWLVSLDTIEKIWPFAIDVLPTPGEVWRFMWNELITETVARRNLYETFWISLRRLLTGFVIAMVVGTILGLTMGLSRAANAFFHDWTVVLLAMPALAWALFNSLIFGFGNKGPIITVILAGIPFVIVNVREGVRNTPRELFDMARSYQVPRLKTTRHVLVPSLMPFMFAAARYCFSIGWKGLVIAEVFGGQDGAGWTIKFWYDAHRAHGVVGYAAFFVIFAILFERAVFEPISKRAFRWRPNLDGGEVVEEVFDEENTFEDSASVSASDMIDDNE